MEVHILGLGLTPEIYSYSLHSQKNVITYRNKISTQQKRRMYPNLFILHMHVLMRQKQMIKDINFIPSSIYGAHFFRIYHTYSQD